ncbi:MATE family efflux transporter [Alteromonas sp. SM 2104]|nr:MATE family efflux transporter [Alteromonas oceanisediminis]
MILANITTPLLGLVDTAVLGHLPSVHALAGASVAALIITQLYWVCGFLRMTVTGLSAQQRGHYKNAPDPDLQYFQPLVQGMALALGLALALFILQLPLFSLGTYFAEATEATRQSMQAYFFVRIYGAPAALSNLVLIGWLVGQQQTRAVMLIQIGGNVVNVVLNLVFVLLLEWGVRGVAAATVIAEFAMLIAGLILALRTQRRLKIDPSWFTVPALKGLFSLNTAMFIRNLLLQACLAFITFKGAQLGASIAAVNAILMQFFVLIALGLDGIAYAVEALIGEAKGEKNINRLAAHATRGLLWSSIFALGYSGFFWLGGDWVIMQLTNQAELQSDAIGFLPLMIVLPLIAHWCFLYDGIYVGLSHAKAMRNSMLVSAVGVFFPTWWLLQNQGNWALWYAFSAFLGARGVTLAWAFRRDLQTGHALR